MAVYWGYVEVEGHANNGSKDHDRLGVALHALQTSMLGKVHVANVIQANQGQEPVTVKHFGWDARCADKCTHEGAAHGIRRYFGLHFVTIERVGSVKLCGTWEVNPQAHVVICGLDHSYPKDGALSKARKLS